MRRVSTGVDEGLMAGDRREGKDASRTEGQGALRTMANPWLVGGVAGLVLHPGAWRTQRGVLVLEFPDLPRYRGTPSPRHAAGLVASVTKRDLGIARRAGPTPLRRSGKAR